MWSYLDEHFPPTIGATAMGTILPSHVQRWVTTAAEGRPVARVRTELPHQSSPGPGAGGLVAPRAGGCREAPGFKGPCSTSALVDGTGIRTAVAVARSDQR
jgi:hypothetical protein